MSSSTKNIVIAVILLLCTGCGPFYYKSTFDKAEAEQMMRPGRNKIIVNCFSKDPHNGEIVTCAGQTSSLFPATERAVEYVRFIWGREEGGQKKISWVMSESERIQNNDPDFDKFKTEKVCDSEGFVTFNNVADGEFYIYSTTPETRRAHHLVYVAKVKVQDGETKKVVLRGHSHEPDNIYFDEDYQKMLKWKRLEKEWFIRHSYWDPKKKRRMPL